MALFNRGNSSRSSDDHDSGDGAKKDKGSWKRPANTAFKQQRLKAWQPILTPRTVLPVLFIIAVIFAPIGAVLLLASNSVSQITLDYTKCSTAGAEPVPMPTYDYQLRSSDANKKYGAPTWRFTAPVTPDASGTCTLRYELPADFGAPVFLYYRLTNFYQNHRRYVRSLDSDQLKGTAKSADALSGGDCKPLDKDPETGKPIYPCGLIANSKFNDSIGNPVWLNPQDTSQPNQQYEFSYTNIAWPGEKKKYTDAPQYKPTDVVPPPNWRKEYPNYDGGFPKLASDEHFQNWMRTAGLPTFTKLYGRNDDKKMIAGTYELNITMNFPVEQFGGTKSVVISTVAWIGGKNPFLGWSYVATAGLFMLLALAGTLRHFIKPRKLGDMSLLSWNQPAKR